MEHRFTIPHCTHRMPVGPAAPAPVKEFDARAASRQDLSDRFVMGHTGQFHIKALEFEGQPVVVDAQAMKDRGVHVVNVDRLVHNVS